MTTTNEMVRQVNSQSLLRTFTRNVKAGLLRHRKAIFYGFTRVLVSTLLMVGFYGCVMGAMFYKDNLHEISLLFFAVSSGSLLLVACLVCFVASVRRAMFGE